jgi:NAD(P)H dehydrogenase (quinone)
VSIVVTGATGHLGRLVVESLLERGVPAGQIVATGRDITKIKDLEDRGVQVRHVDFDKPETIRPAFEGAEKLLLVSGSELGKRVPQHANAIDAAKAAGVGFIAYTSAPHADTTSLQLAAEHKATEELIRASGLPFALLRNSWYFEVYTDQFPTYLQHGAIIGSAGEGRISGASRADYAEAAAVVLATDGHEGKVYELSGDDSFTLSDLAAEITKQSGTQVTYSDLPLADYQQALLGFGLPEPVAAIYADIDRGVAAGELHITSGDLRRLIGRPTTPLSSAVASALA